MPVTIAAVGTAESISTVDIHAQVTGQLQAMNFTPGEDVRKGQPLFTIDPRPFEAALSQAQAALARDTAQADDAKLQRDRFETLFNRGLIPRDQYDTQTASVTAFDATLASDRAQVEQAQLNLQYHDITAPINGRSGALLVHAGDLIRANDTDPMVTLNQLAPIDVTFAVPGRLLVDIQRFNGQSPLTVTATSQASTVPSAQPQGKVTFIDNAVDPTTATIKLKATFANNDRRLWPGLFVQVALQLSSRVQRARRAGHRRAALTARPSTSTSSNPIARWRCVPSPSTVSRETRRSLAPACEAVRKWSRSASCD